MSPTYSAGEQVSFAARISRVRMKNGGADVRVLNNKHMDDGGEDWRGSIVKNARVTADFATDKAPLVGYLMVGMYADGMTSASFRYDTERCPIPRALLPAWLAEVVRRDILMDGEARDVFNEMFEWRDN